MGTWPSGVCTYHTPLSWLSLATSACNPSSAITDTFPAESCMGLPLTVPAQCCLIGRAATRRCPIGDCSRSTAASPRLLVFLGRFPLRAVNRREYQVFVHILHSVAAITARRPVLPLAHCTANGEWSEDSRCVYVVHAQQPAGLRRATHACAKLWDPIHALGSSLRF